MFPLSRFFPSRLLALPFSIPSAKLPIDDPLRPHPPLVIARTNRKDRVASGPPPKAGPFAYSDCRRTKEAFLLHGERVRLTIFAADFDIADAHKGNDNIRRVFAYG